MSQTTLENETATAEKITLGTHHVGLTVEDLGDAQSFFEQVLGFSKVGEVPDYPAIFLSDDSTMITLWQVQDKENAVSFDRKNNIGLHHMAIKVSNIANLEKLHEKIASHALAEVEFGPEPLGESGLTHMMCQIPGGGRLELIT